MKSLNSMIAGVRDPQHVAVEADQHPFVRIEGVAVAELQAVLVAADLAPPSPTDLAAAIGVDRELLNDLLKLLVERGLAVRVTPEVFVMRSAEERARETIRRLARSGAVPPGEFRQALGLSRKHLIPLLEYMDRAGVTRRTPEGRISNEVD